jgi:hypothetical protein
MRADAVLDLPQLALGQRSALGRLPVGQTWAARRLPSGGGGPAAAELGQVGPDVDRPHVDRRRQRRTFRGCPRPVSRSDDWPPRSPEPSCRTSGYRFGGKVVDWFDPTRSHLARKYGHFRGGTAPPQGARGLATDRAPAELPAGPASWRCACPQTCTRLDLVRLDGDRIGEQVLPPPASLDRSPGRSLSVGVLPLVLEGQPAMPVVELPYESENLVA